LILKNFENIQNKVKEHSNFAELIEISPRFIGRTLHLGFVYETGDAAGQNMSTICTWNTCRWILDRFTSEMKIAPIDFILEGNLSGDKRQRQFLPLKEGALVSSPNVLSPRIFCHRS